MSDLALTVITLTEAVAHAFSPQGPVARVMGQHRPAQSLFARHLAEYAESGTASVSLNEAFAGVGKTIVVQTVMGLDLLINQRRGTIATHTRALLRDYVDGIAKANLIIKLTMAQLMATQTYHQISVGEYKSALSYLSPSKMAHLGELVATNRVTDPATVEFSRVYQEFLDAGVEPDFNQMAEYCPLPDNSTQLHWAFCFADRKTGLWKQILEDREAARAADILLVTHSMLIRNSLASGEILNTVGLEEGTRNGLLVIDEAEKLPSIAYDAMTATVAYNDIVDIVGDVVENYKRKPEDVRFAEATIRSGLDALEGWRDSARRRLVMDMQDDIAKTIIAALRNINNGLALLIRALHTSANRDLLLIDEVFRLRQELAKIINAEGHDHTKLALRSTFDLEGKVNLQILINYSAGRNLINQMWRAPHSFSGLIMVSATLTDLPPFETTYGRFLMVIGYDPAKDSLDQHNPLPRRSFGRIDEVVVAARTAPHPTDPTQPDYISANFIEFAATSLTTLAARQATMSPDTRALVLFPSYRLLDRVWEALPHLHERIVRTKRGINLQTAIGEFARKTHGLFFSIEWEGMNFIDPIGGRTLADLMVIVRLPQPPSDEMRIARLNDVFGTAVAAQRKAEWVALREANNSAFRRMVHGVARGIRRADDVIKQLMILDIRFPVPPHVVDTRQIARSAGDPSKIFSRFDACLGPYHVRGWSQIDEQGVIAKLL